MEQRYLIIVIAQGVSLIKLLAFSENILIWSMFCIGTANGSTSELSYKPQSERDYGTLSCRGTNGVGRQLDPCVFQIVPAGKLILIKSEI